MRIGLLSDAHGNPLSLSRCLAALGALAVDTIYFLGDATGYFPGEVEVLSLLSGARASCVLGNHDAMVIGRLPISTAQALVYRRDEARARLGDGGIAVLLGWPETRHHVLHGRRAFFAHGDPFNALEGYCYPDTSLETWATLPYDLFAVGHTHRPFIRSVGAKLIINAGSCGLPRDEGSAPSFAVYDSAANTAVIHRVRVQPEEVLAQFEPGRVADGVKQCLYRRADSPLVGQFIGDAV